MLMMIRSSHHILIKSKQTILFWLIINKTRYKQTHRKRLIKNQKSLSHTHTDKHTERQTSLKFLYFINKKRLDFCFKKIMFQTTSSSLLSA